MKTGLMANLFGADNNMKMVDTPLRIFNATMDRATVKRSKGYMDEFSAKAIEFKNKAQVELQKEQAEAREKLREDQQAAIEKSREQAREFQKRLSDKDDTDTRYGVNEINGKKNTYDYNSEDNDKNRTEQEDSSAAKIYGNTGKSVNETAKYFSAQM